MDISVYAKYKASVIVTSDTCFQDPAKDESGQVVVDHLERLGFSDVKKIIVPDEKETIAGSISQCSKDKDMTLLITVGGTGLCPRDVTPEACEMVYQKVCSGIAAALMATCLRYSPHAALSRLTSGIVNYSLVINFPGKTKACNECFSCIESFLEHALEQVRFDPTAIRNTHLRQEEMNSLQTKAILTNNNHILDGRLPDNSTENVSNSNVTASPSVSNTISLNQGSEAMDQEPIRSTILPDTTTNPISQPSNPINPQNAPDHSYAQTSSISISSIVLKDLKTQSTYKLIEYEEALGLLSSISYELCQDNVETVALDSVEAAAKILGHILAKDLCSLKCVPPYRVSTMDGYVVNVPRQLRAMLQKNSIKAPVRQVMNYEQFEAARRDINERENFLCYPVNTGGRVPEEDFAVVPVEDTDGKDEQDRVKIRGIKLNCYTRATGSDLNLEDCLLAGTEIGPVELSLIVAMGHKSVDIVRKPVISVMSSGDELISYREDGPNRKDPTRVLDVNEPLLAALFHERGFKVLREGIVRDNFEAIKKKIIESLSSCDVLVITGGASMGTKDFVKDALEALGCKIHFGRVNIKPGKPAAFATVMINTRRKFIFSLPGNPVSAYVTSQMLVLPFVEFGMRNFRGESMGFNLLNTWETFSVRISRVLDDTEAGYFFEDRLEFLRARFPAPVEGKQAQGAHQDVEVSIRQQSSRLLSLKDCDCLVLVERGQQGKRLAVDQFYTAIRLRK